MTSDNSKEAAKLRAGMFLLKGQIDQMRKELRESAKIYEEMRKEFKILRGKEYGKEVHS